MKKKDIQKQKRKLKVYEGFKLIKYATYMCTAMILIFLFYVMALATQTSGGFAELFKNNLFITIGFIVCTVNLIIRGELKKIYGDLLEISNVEESRTKLVLFAIIELILFNYATAALLLFSLIRYFNWGRQMETIKTVRESKSIKSIVVTTFALICLTSFSYYVIFVALTV